MKFLIVVSLIISGCANYKPYQRMSDNCLGAECITSKNTWTADDYNLYHQKMRYIGIEKAIDVKISR